MTEPPLARTDALPTLAEFVAQIERLEMIVQSWDASQRATVEALRQAVDALHKEAVTRLIRSVKADPGAQPALTHAVRDDVVYAVLRHFQVLRPSLQERVELALDTVRPLLRGHGGDVELVRVDPPDRVEIRLTGACDGCPASGLTLTEGVEKAIREQCPEITTIAKARASLSRGPDGSKELISPFALSTQHGWAPALELMAIPDRGLAVREVHGRSLLFSRQGDRVTCFDNACAHMGMPLEMGMVAEGLLTCPYHGFCYDLSSGECVTVPEVQLVPHHVRIVGTTVEVQVKR